jgi:hypothetical protein
MLVISKNYNEMDSQQNIRLFWSWRPFDTLRSVLGIFPSAIVAELFTQF